MELMKRVVLPDKDARNKAESLGHKMSPFTPYGDRKYSYCENSTCKAHLTLQGEKVEGNALSHVRPLLEGEGQNGG